MSKEECNCPTCGGYNMEQGKVYICTKDGNTCIMGICDNETLSPSMEQVINVLSDNYENQNKDE